MVHNHLFGEGAGAQALEYRGAVLPVQASPAVHGELGFAQGGHALIAVEAVAAGADQGHDHGIAKPGRLDPRSGLDHLVGMGC